MKLVIKQSAAMMASKSLTMSDVPIGPSAVKYGKMYNPSTTIATNITPSQMRRCQNRLIGSGVMMPPVFDYS